MGRVYGKEWRWWWNISEIKYNPFILQIFTCFIILSNITFLPFSALGLPPESSSELSSILSAVDPTSTGYVTYPTFLTAAAAKLHSRSADALSAEVDSAYRLFTYGRDGPITLNHLRRIARELKEDSVTDELLRDMIEEANGGAGVNAGVTLEQFLDVMQRAGVFWFEASRICMIESWNCVCM